MSQKPHRKKAVKPAHDLPGSDQPTRTWRFLPNATLVAVAMIGVGIFAIYADRNVAITGNAGGASLSVAANKSEPERDPIMVDGDRSIGLRMENVQIYGSKRPLSSRDSKDMSIRDSQFSTAVPSTFR